MSRNRQTHRVAAFLGRPENGPVWSGSDVLLGAPLGGQPAWMSNGGPHRGHPARSYPFSFEATVPADQGPLVKVHMVGVFALFAEKHYESAGTLGASVQLQDERDVVFRHDLLHGRHYSDARDLTPVNWLVGDGTSLETVGVAEVLGSSARVDILSIDVPDGAEPSVLRFKDLGSPASFVVFDVLFEHEVAGACPFRSRVGGVSLGELGAVVRVGDRVRFQRAVAQLEQALLVTDGLDEARGQALTFLAVVTSGMLERHGGREMHLELLEASRELERASNPADVAAVARRRIDAVSRLLFADAASPSSHLVDRALALVERNYAKDLTDATVADQLGLSTSHFRFLFKQTTGQPFHKYLVALRLEKARRLLIDGDLPVSDVARAVGFTGLSHFSRAFSLRFQVSPTNVRRGAQ